MAATNGRRHSPWGGARARELVEICLRFHHVLAPEVRLQEALTELGHDMTYAVPHISAAAHRGVGQQQQPWRQKHSAANYGGGQSIDAKVWDAVRNSNLRAARARGWANEAAGLAAWCGGPRGREAGRHARHARSVRMHAASERLRHSPSQE